MGARHEQVLDRIFFVGRRTLEALAATPLGTVGVGWRALDVSSPADRDHHRGLGDQLRHVADVAHLAADLRAPVVGMLALDLDELRADERLDVGLTGENPPKLPDLREQFAVLTRELLLLEVHELPKREPEDRVGLHRREAVCLGRPALLREDREAFGAERPLEQRCRRLDLAQPLLGLGLRLRTADDPDHLVDVGERDEQALERVLAAAGLREQMLRAAADHRGAVPEELVEHALERQDPRLAVDERQEDERERRLERRELVELIEHDVGVGIALELEDQPHRLLEITLVADRRDALDAVFIHELGDLLLDRIAGLLIRNLRDHDPAAVLAELLDMCPGPQRDRAPARQIAAHERLAAHHDAAGREVGARHDFQDLGHRRGRIVDQLHERPAHLAEVVRRDARGHAHGDAAGAVDHEVGKPARQHDGLGVPLVVRRHEVDRVELEIVEHERGDRREPGLGVSHGGRGQAGDRAEVALLVDEHVPHVPFLGHAHERGVDHALTVRVVVAAGVAGDLRALHAGGAGRQIEIVHGDQDPPLRRLEPVADVGQGPADDHAHCVRQVTVFELLLDGQLDQPPARNVTERPVPPGCAVPRRSLAVQFFIICQGALSRSFPESVRP